MSARSRLVLELSEHVLGVLSAAEEGGRLRIERAFDVPIPIELAHAEGPVLGRWIRAQLDDAGVGARSAVIGVGRGEVVLKTLRFDAVSDEDADLPGMIRLKMGRQLAFPGDEATIDYDVIARDESRTVALAVAMPTSRLERVGAALRASGLKAERMGLVTEGVARLIGRRGAQDGATLCLALAGRRCDLLVARAGRLLYARSADYPQDRPDVTPEQLARWLTTEARRTWMSYRMAPGAVDVSDVLVLGDARTATVVADACGRALELSASGVSEVAALDDRLSRAPTSDDGGLGVRLAGMLLDAPGIDLASPRRPPDRAARARQLAMAALLTLVVVIGGLLTWANRARGAAEATLGALRERRNEILAERAEAVRSAARLDHALAWSAGEPDWLEHMARLADALPERGALVLDRFEGVARPALAYEPPSRRGAYDSKWWARRTSVVFTISGRAADRDVADAARGAFVVDGRYYASPIGADGRTTNDERYPHVFAVQLTATERVDEEGGASDE